MRLWHFCFLLMLTLPLASCSRNDEFDSVETSNPSAVESELKSAEPQPAITTSVESIAQLEQRIASHSGKVVVVDLWALW